MTKKLVYIITVSAGLFMTFSCNKYLELEPQDGIIRQEFWQTKEQVQAAVNGCYASLLGGTDRSLAEYLFLWGELRADMLQAGTSISANELDVMNVNISSSNPLVNWQVMYQTINYCNTVIDLAPQVLEHDVTLKKADLDAYIGETRALRALLYFYLVRSFDQVPLKLNATTSEEDIIDLPKSSQQDVLKQITEDLKIAEQHVPKTYNNRDMDKGRITWYTINAILADVYLWMEDYDNCITYCDKIIQSNQFGLIAGDENWFTTLYYQGNSNESIFEFQFHQNKLNSFYNMLAASNKRFRAAIRVLDEVYTIDYIDIENKDLRADGASVKQSDGSVWKYQGINATTARASSASFAHWTVYRYADILLMKAEALNQRGEGQPALDLISTIRARAHALPATEKILTPDDKDGIAEYILDERAREFAFEGKRWYDLLRNAKRDNYARIDLLLSVVASTALPQNQQSAIIKYQDHNSHYFPIFLYELETNKKLIQNPFYQQ